MENTPLINDLLIMLSAIGSAVAGVLCGWQLRSANGPRSQTAVLEQPADEPNEADEPILAETANSAVVSVAALEPLPSITRAALDPTQMLDGKKPLLEEDSFLGHHDPFATLYGEQPQGLSASEIREVAERLIHVADRITADVDAHDAHLNEVSNSLHSDRSAPTMESVMAAVERLLTANETMQAQLRESRDRIVEQAQQIDSAETKANTDALTRLSNRRAFDRELSNWNREKPGVLALLDIDHFKKFNDQFGHRAGDEVLRRVASILRSRLEKHCLVARYGGEEFGLVFTNNRLEDVLDLIESARRSIAAEEATFEGQTFNVSCSMGVTRMLADEPASDALQRADDGLYMSKDSGRNCGHCIDSLTVGVREAPYRLGPKTIALTEAVIESTKRPVKKMLDDESEAAKKISRRASNQAILERIPNRDSLGDSYRELLQRLGKAPVKLSVIAVSVAEPEATLEASGSEEPITRFARLLEVAQAYCRPVDRVGYQDEQTLLICMPGIEGDAMSDRVAELRGVAIKQLQVNELALSIGASSIEIGDTFDRIVNRAVEQAQH